MFSPPASRNDFEIAIVCALPKEVDAIALIFDQFWVENVDRYGRALGDKNIYRTGRIGNFNVVLVQLPGAGKINATGAAATIQGSFPAINLAFVCGICAGIPGSIDGEEILLGDVVVSKTVVQYDLGKQNDDGFKTKGTLDDSLGRPVKAIRHFVAQLEGDHFREQVEEQAAQFLTKIQRSSRSRRVPNKYSYPGATEDRVSPPTCHDSDGLCEKSPDAGCGLPECKSYQIRQRRLAEKLKQEKEGGIEEAQAPYIFVGRIGCGDKVVKSAEYRDKLAKDHGLIALEMEGAGVWDEIPCILIKGVCDYGDNHKTDVWQHFAAATAASVTKALILKHPKTDRPFAGRERAVNKIRHVPYLENTKFSGREEPLATIYNLFVQSKTSSQQRRLVLQGFPGIGKTELALQYSIKYESLYEGVFWVDARPNAFISPSQASETVPRVISREIDRIDRQVQKQTGLTLQDWCLNKRWLMVIDNLDDSQELQAQLPIPQGPGDVLITSRRTDLNELGTVIEIPPLEEKEAVELLYLYGENRRKEDNDEETALKLVQLLSRIPLAIRTCGCLVSEQRQGFSSYIKEFDDLMIDLAIPEAEDGHKDITRFHLNDRRSILGTFEISLLYLREYSDNVTALLFMMANLDPKDIPELILQRGLEKHKRWTEQGNIQETFSDGMPQWLQQLPRKPWDCGFEKALKILQLHFWLRWKQQTSQVLDPFRDCLSILNNGYPQPDFSRIYGLATQHEELREIYQPHLQVLLKNYKQLKEDIMDDCSILFPLVEVFLNASQTPEELRPMTKRAFPSTDIESPFGTLNPLDQDLTFLSTIEDIIAHLHYPGNLFLRAVYVFFEYFNHNWAKLNPGRRYKVKDIRFAGKSLQEIRGNLTDIEAPLQYPDNNKEYLPVLESDRSVLEDIATLMPLIEDPTVGSVIDATRDMQSGLMGLIEALKYTEYIEIILSIAIHKLELSLSKGVNFIVIDCRRFMLPLFLSTSWIQHFPSLLESTNDQLSDLTKFSHAQLVLTGYEARNLFKGAIHSISAPLKRWVVNAAAFLSATMGPESVVGATSLYMRIWDGTHSSPPTSWVENEEIEAILDTPITKENYYFKIKLIDAWQYSLAERNLLRETKDLITGWLQKFLDCDNELRSFWSFSTDPILDLYEFAIHFHEIWFKDEENATKYRTLYMEYFDENYHTLVERLCLGCGAGVFGMRHARIRLEIIPSTVYLPSADEISKILFPKLQAKLGISGSCLPYDATRLREQEWCYMRLQSFLQATSGRVAGKVSRATLRSTAWGSLPHLTGISDEDIFQKEADRVIEATLEAVSEAILEVIILLLDGSEG